MVRFMNKTLLILAASSYQLPVIHAAKRMGYRVITVDNQQDNPGHSFADKSYCIDTTDYKNILTLAKKENIDGIISPATDVSVSTAAYVAERMNLPNIPLDSAVLLTNKSLFRQFLKEKKFSTPKVISPINDALLELNFQNDQVWIVKPSVSSGSKGVFVVFNKEDLYKHLTISQSMSKNGEVILEKYIEGSQHTCEGILDRGKVKLALITDRNTAPFPYTTTIGHRVPTRLSNCLQYQAIQVIQNIFSLLHIESGPFDCDFVATEKQIILLEMTPRLGGNSLTQLVRSALGFDLVAYAVAHACGDKYPLPTVQKIRPAAVSILGVWRQGMVNWDSESELNLRQEEWVDYLSFDIIKGSLVYPFINGRHRVGELLIHADNREQLDARVQICMDRLALEVE